MIYLGKIRCLLALGASHLALLGATVHAETPGPKSQDPSPPAAAAHEQDSGLYEIVVTAQRRAESLKDVPISVQALTGAQLSRQAMINTQDLASISPTVNFSSQNSANAASFSLRGVSSVAVQTGIQPSTAMVLDGVPVARQAEFLSELVDIERIEVLNGPQGTLFGKNSTAGVINIVTKRPTNAFEAMVEGLATTDEEYGVRAMVNAPLSEGARLRVGGFYRDQTPFVKNLSGPGGAGAKSWGINGKLDVDLSSDADFLLAGGYAHTNSSYGVIAPIGPSIFGAQQQALVGAPIVRGGTTVNNDTPNVDITRVSYVTGTLNWKLNDELSLVSISNYTNFSENSLEDSDATPAGANFGRGDSIPNTTYPFFAVAVSIRDRFPLRYAYFSQELRMNYKSGPINAVFGLYYQNYHDSYRLELPFVLDGFLVGGTPGQHYITDSPTSDRLKDRTASVFGDVTYALTDQIKVFGGLRFTDEKISVDYHRNDFFGPYSIFNPVTATFSAPPILTVNTKADNTTYNLSGRTGVQYEPTNNLNFYFSYARGYKGPAADVGTTLAPNTNPIIRPEIADAFEIGAKLRLFDQRVALNAAVFHEVINGIQETTVPPNGSTFTESLVNAGSLTTRGVEGDAQWAITPALRLGGGLAYVDATYSGFSFNCYPTQVCPNFGGRQGFQNLTGQQAVDSPKWKYSLTTDYENQFPGKELSYFGHVNWTWTSSVQHQLSEDPLTREPSHGLLGASVGIKWPDDRWEVQFFGKNLTNQHYYTYLYDIGTIGQIGFFPRDFERYGGVKVTYRYR
jgi:iron complex outermembrane receptor protein